MFNNIKKEKPIIQFFVLSSFFIMGIIIIFTPIIVMEKLIVTKFNLSVLQYIIVRSLEMLYSIALFIFGAYGGYIFIKRLINNG